MHSSTLSHSTHLREGERPKVPFPEIQGSSVPFLGAQSTEYLSPHIASLLYGADASFSQELRLGSDRELTEALMNHIAACSSGMIGSADFFSHRKVAFANGYELVGIRSEVVLGQDSRKQLKLILDYKEAQTGKLRSCFCLVNINEELVQKISEFLLPLEEKKPSALRKPPPR